MSVCVCVCLCVSVRVCATFFKDGVFRMVFRNTSSLLSTSFFAIRMPGFALVVLLECCLLRQMSQQLLFATLFILLLGRRFRLQTPNDI